MTAVLPDEVAEIAMLHRKGMPLIDVSEWIGCTVEEARAALPTCGLTDRQLAKARRHLAAGASLRAAAYAAGAPAWALDLALWWTLGRAA